MNKEDLIGRKVGKLTVIKFDKIVCKRDNKGKNRDIGYWLCKCDCGNEVSISRNKLVTNKVKSCGCLIQESAEKRAKRQVIDLAGKRFGKLLVLGLERTEKRRYKNANRTIYFWKCRCDCGNELVVNGKTLKEGKIKDCKDVKRNASKTYTQIGNEFKRENILKEGTRLDNISDKLSKANTSGVRGVAFQKERNKYRARITFQNVEYHLGYFNNLEDAKRAREKAEEIYYKPILEKYNYTKEDEEEFE